LMMLSPGPGVLPPLALTAFGGIGTIDLSWGEPTAQSFAIDAYVVYRSTFSGFYYGDPGLEIARVSTTYFTDSTYYGLIPGLLYYYTVKAYDMNVNYSLPSNIAYASDPLAADMILPKADDIVTGNVFIVGTASGSDFSEYVVTISGPGNSRKTRELARSNNRVFKSVLAGWDVGKAEHGRYVVELCVIGRSGKSIKIRHVVHVGHGVYLAGHDRDSVMSGNSMSEVAETRGARQFTNTVAIRP